MQRGLEVIGGGLAALRIERTGFEKNIGTTKVQPLSDILRRRGRTLRPMAVEQGQRVQAVGIGDPAGAARGDSSQTPANVVAAAQVRLFRDEQTE